MKAINYKGYTIIQAENYTRPGVGHSYVVKLGDERIGGRSSLAGAKVLADRDAESRQNVHEIQVYLTVEADGIRVYEFPTRGLSEDRSLGLATTHEELREILFAKALRDGAKEGDELRGSFVCSSSMDFPEEETERGDVIALAREIRN